MQLSVRNIARPANWLRSLGSQASEAGRRLLGIEALVALAIAATCAALYYREPLTSKTLVIGAEARGKSFDTYQFDDSSNGGNSAVSPDPRQPLSWTCSLNGAIEWPYCGFGLLFDRDRDNRGLDFSKYDRLQLRVSYEGSGEVIRIVLKDHDQRYRAFKSPLDKVNQANFPIRRGTQVIQFRLSDLTVAEWWKDQTKALPELARPSFGNIVALEFVTGAGLNPGEQHWLRVHQVSLHRQFISREAWFGGLALGWILLIGGLMLHRRRQIAILKQSAEQALQQSERLYRGILEASTDAIILFDRNGIAEFVNGSAVEAMEVDSAGRVLGKHWTRLWRDESASLVAAALDRAGQGKSDHLRAFCATSKGTPKWWDIVVAPMIDDQGELNGLLTISRDVTSEREQSEKLRWASEHDPLTKLPNRRAFQTHLQAATLRAMQTGKEIGLLLIDLDHFKHVNDSFGHTTGDELLTAVANRLRKSVGSGDFVARIGGDEFAVIVESVACHESLVRTGKSVVASIDAPVKVARRVLQVGASVGGALFPTNARCANSLFTNADTALYALKQNGRGGFRLFDDYMLEDAEKAASQLNLARRAVTEKSVVPVYQPKVELETGNVVGLEALLRWRDARHSLQSPSTVEEAFNDYELAAKIGELMQNKVAADMRRWLEDGVNFGRVSINAAPAEFLRDDYAERLLRVLAEHQVPPDRLEVEVTEHAFLGRGPEYVARALDRLSMAGVSVSLDDFGTGCSSLAHLRDFPVDVVKVDMSFVQQMAENPEIAAIVAAVVKLALSLSIEVVAEGVETPAQLELLRAMGCHMAQGHLFGAAVEAPEIAQQVPLARVAA